MSRGVPVREALGRLLVERENRPEFSPEGHRLAVAYVFAQVGVYCVGPELS